VGELPAETESWNPGFANISSEWLAISPRVLP